MRNLLSLATNESSFIFNEDLFKKRIELGSPLDPTLAYDFLCFYEKKWLEKCRRYVDYIFVLFKSTDHLERFRNYFNTCHPRICPFHLRKKKNDKLSFLEVNITRENGKFVTTVCRLYSFWESFTFYTKIWFGLYLSI